eukprot:10685154-Heterocapsa_arctica.AAC.1
MPCAPAGMTANGALKESGASVESGGLVSGGRSSWSYEAQGFQRERHLSAAMSSSACRAGRPH